MPTILNNLYPPVVRDVQPAFVRNSSKCRIYFSLSKYNSTEEIKNVQVSLVNQKTNQSALNASKYPSGIKIANLGINSQIQNDYKYYIDLTITNKTSTSDFITGYPGINQYYMVQLRFTSTQAPNPPSTGTGLDAWLYENRDYFSEWSQVLLIKAIEKPQITLAGLEAGVLKQLSSPPNQITGRLSFSNENETEYLKSYNIVIYETSAGISNPSYKTQQIYTNQYGSNEINCDIPYDFETNVSYGLALTYITNNLYTETLYYRFKIDSEPFIALNGEVSITPEEEDGSIKFDVNFEGTTPPAKSLLIQRASSRTNFKIWETLKTIPYNKNSLRSVWYDTTIESGVWYKYRIKQEQEDGLGRINETEEPIMCVFEHIFLTDEDKQLKIQFNPTIGDFKYNIMESQQITLGSKYPYVKRNGNNFFRSFSIGGLISAFMDDKDWYKIFYEDGKFRIENKKLSFTSPFETYNDSKDLYKEYNSENNINQYNDYIYEREFRQKVQDFLYKNNVKLFRSLTEGNILIKLQNVAFQPMDSLGRRLYSFTATAVEVDDFATTNFSKYSLINKYYYSYRKGTLTASFKPGESLISKYILKQPALAQYNPETFKIYRIDIQLSQAKNATFYLKTIDDPEMVQYETKLGLLNLRFGDEEPVEECYFYGIHLNDDQFTLTNEYYYKTSDIDSPIANGVYYIYYESNDAYKINHYITYDGDNGVLTTYEEETERKLDRNYILYVEGEYAKYIYYEGEWYPFSEDNVVMINTTGKITYYYEVREVN